jgi:hypothetical protein
MYNEVRRQQRLKHVSDETRWMPDKVGRVTVIIVLEEGRTVDSRCGMGLWQDPVAPLVPRRDQTEEFANSLILSLGKSVGHFLSQNTRDRVIGYTTVYAIESRVHGQSIPQVTHESARRHARSV